MENLHGRGFPYSPGELNFQSPLHSTADGQASFSQGGVNPQMTFPYLQSVTNAAYHHPPTFQGSTSERDALGGGFAFPRFQDSLNPLHPSVPENVLPHLSTFHSGGQTDGIERSRISSPHLRQPYDASAVNALMESSALGLPTSFQYGSQPSQFGQTPESLVSSFFTSTSSSFSSSNFLMQANRLHGLPTSVGYDTSTVTAADTFSSQTIATSKPFHSNVHESLPPISIPKKRQFLPNLTSSDASKSHPSYSPEPLSLNKPEVDLRHCIPSVDAVNTSRSETISNSSLSPANTNNNHQQLNFTNNSCQDYTEENSLAKLARNKQADSMYLGADIPPLQQKAIMENLNEALSTHSADMHKSPRMSLHKSSMSSHVENDSRCTGQGPVVTNPENDVDIPKEDGSYAEDKNTSLEEESENDESDQSDEIINCQPRVKFFLKGKLARQNFHHLRPTQPIIDFSFESPLYSELDYAYAANVYAYTRIRRESLSRPQHITLDKPNIFMESNNVYDGNSSYMDDDSDCEKDGTGVNKRKARRPSFYQSMSSHSGDKENKTEEELNEEYLVRSNHAAEMLNYFRNSAAEENANLSPEAKKAKMKLQPYAITSPSFSKAAARAVMTTTVSNNATVVTISIANKKSLKKGKTKSVDTVEGSVMSMGLTEVSGGDGGDSFSDDKEDANDDSKEEEDPSAKVGMERTSIMSKLKRDNENFGNDNSDDGRMEINIRIDDSQLIQHGEQKRWQCHLCQKSYTTKHNLVTHILDHNGIKPHLCMVCGKYFKQLSHLNTHMLTHDNIKPHVCTVCNKGFTQISHLKRHQAVHLESRPYICDICERGFAYPSELRTHKEKHATGKENKCVDCGEEFDCQRALKQHQVIHGNCENLICKYCSKVFRYPSQLKDHLICHEGSRQFICGECGMDFMKEHHLRAHQFTHSGQRPWSCPECGRRFNQKANMQRHMLIHNSTRAFKCETCGKTFTQPQTLKAHLVVHAEKKPYQCKFCGKQFGRLHNLQGHMHMHNNSKPYVCFCGSSFTLKGNLNRHKKVKHGLNETTESMEEEAVNFLSELSERSRVEADEDNDNDNDYEDQNFSPDSNSYRKNRKSVPRKFLPRSSLSDEGDEDNSDDDEDDDQDPKIKLEKSTEDERENDTSFEDRGTPVEKKQLRKRKRKAPERISLSENENTGELSDSEKDDNIKEEPEDYHDSDWIPRKAKKQRTSRGGNLDSIIAEKFKSH